MPVIIYHNSLCMFIRDYFVSDCCERFCKVIVPQNTRPGCHGKGKTDFGCFFFQIRKTQGFCQKLKCFLHREFTSNTGKICSFKIKGCTKTVSCTRIFWLLKQIFELGMKFLQQTPFIMFVIVVEGVLLVGYLKCNKYSILRSKTRNFVLIGVWQPARVIIETKAKVQKIVIYL